MVIYEVYISGAIFSNAEKLNEIIKTLEKIHYTHFEQWKNFPVRFVPCISIDAEYLQNTCVVVKYENDAKEASSAEFVCNMIRRKTTWDVEGPSKTKFRRNYKAQKK